MRLNFELNNEYVDELRALQEETGSATMKELFGTAISTLQSLLEERKRGNEIAAVNEGKKVFRVLMIPVLERAARKSRVAFVEEAVGTLTGE